MVEKIVGRDGKIYLRCEYCGHIFKDSKKYTKHLYKSHILNIPKKKRLKKKFSNKLIEIKIKLENNIKLNKYEKLLLLKSKLSGIKLF